MKKEPKKWNKNMHSVCDDYDIALEKTEEKEKEVEKKNQTHTSQHMPIDNSTRIQIIY